MKMIWTADKEDGMDGRQQHVWILHHNPESTEKSQLVYACSFFGNGHVNLDSVTEMFL